MTMLTTWHNRNNPKFRNYSIEMQILKCLNLFEHQHIYYDHLHFMRTL